MLPPCCHLVALLLPFKCLTDNDVADVATFQTISTCKTHIKWFNINVVAGFLLVLEHVILAYLEFRHGSPIACARMEDGGAMNRAKSSLIGVNGEPSNPRLRRLSNRVKPRQTT